MTESVTDLLGGSFILHTFFLFTPDTRRSKGYEPRELIGRPSLELVHPDEFPRVKKLH